MKINFQHFDKNERGAIASVIKFRDDIKGVNPDDILKGKNIEIHSSNVNILFLGLENRLMNRIPEWYENKPEVRKGDVKHDYKMNDINGVEGALDKLNSQTKH